jgi:nitrate/nitrite-specific signal transduction histidine kinase
MGLLMRWRENGGKNEAFPTRMAQRWGLAIGLALFLVLLVGGISIFLSTSISRDTKVIEAESGEMEHVNRLHIMTHHVVAVVQHAVVSGEVPPDDVEAMLENLNREVAKYLAAELEGEDTPEKAAELAILKEIIGRTSRLGDLSRKIVGEVALARRVDLKATDHLDKLWRLNHEKFERMNRIHEAKMRGSMQVSQAKLKRIIGIYIASALLGGLSLILGLVIFSKTIVLPVQRLASATVDVAAGDFGKRVAVTSKDEIGQLSHSFNVMAKRLEQHEGELRVVQEDLARKVRETEALYRVGMEISSLRELDKILTSVVEKARELLGGEAACLCLQDAQGHLTPRATSGPTREDVAGGPTWANQVIGAGPGMGCEECGRHRPMIEGEHQPAHITVPLMRGERFIGTLCVVARSPRTFSSGEAELLRGLSSQAAIAIENTRLYEQIQNLALLEERERIAMDLHDGIIQSIYAVGLNLEGCAERVKGETRGVREQLERAMDDLNDVIKGIRTYIFNLRPSSSDGRGLTETLAEALKALKVNPSMEVKLIAEEVCGALSEEQVTQVGHITKEALANVLKHARASSVTVRLVSKDHGLILSILDNGVGFDPQMVEPTAGQGLKNMAERARDMGGIFSVKSGQGSGTEISVQIPLIGGTGESRA